MDDIIDKLKKEKKGESVLDSLIKKKDKEEENPTKPNDLEVRSITPEKAPLTDEEMATAEAKKEKPIREFRTEGMHEFDIETLGTSGDMNIKVEYKSRVATLIDENKIAEAIKLLQELKGKLTHS